MTIPGAGGQTPPRPDQQTQNNQPVPVAPGSSAIVRARLVIVQGTGANSGLFVYSGTAGPGNNPVFAAVAPGVTTDPYGNPVSAVVSMGNAGGAHISVDQFGELIVWNNSGQLTMFLQPSLESFLIYNPPAGTGTLAVSMAAAAGTDNFSNAIRGPGVGVYNAGGFPFALLATGTLSFTANNTQFAPGVVGTFGNAGEIGFTSGLVTNTDSVANIVVDSAQASGSGSSNISLQAATTTINSTATTVTPSPNVNPGHQSAAPAAYSQSYEQASTNRINQLMDILVQTGIWHT